jgi:hypothetical protein
MRLTPIQLVVGAAFLGSSAFILYAVLRVRDQTQIPMMSSGFAILGLSFVAIAVGSLINLWRAASRARMGRAVGLAIVGGLAGLAAIGCFTAAVILALLWRSA